MVVSDSFATFQLVRILWMDWCALQLKSRACSVAGQNSRFLLEFRGFGLQWWCQSIGAYRFFVEVVEFVGFPG